ncbi:hypothetical protein JOB18_009370 [Solea senegalensis]|uniref:Dynein regulatory complex subunit 2 n=1 Tax=Solea senegalensis TaxID=28829 RepID=A0AAV6QJC7_SOLSE|nr:dynein regulatory complex subunit 2-like [Solea senegalensis]KAG7493469.1 hypothetical protein JOB18_009370 [Solea senegalensis]
MDHPKEEILPQSQTEKLLEQRSNAVKQLTVNEGWKFILCHTQADELCEDIEIFKQMFERQIDSLDDVIRSLEHDLEEAERQSSHVQRVHLHLLERLRALQNKHVMVLQLQWESNLQHVCSTFNCERKQMMAHSEQRKAQLEEAKVNMEEEHNKIMKEIDKLYSDSINSYRNAHESWEDALVKDGQVMLTELSHQNYKLLRNLRKEQKEVNDLIFKKQQHIQITKKKMAMIKNVEKHREKLRTIQRENELMEQELKNSINEVRQKTFILRDRLTLGHSAAKRQLIDLIMQSDAAIRKLQTVIIKGERVLRVGKMCWKLERKLRHKPIPSGGDYQISDTEEKEEITTSDVQELPRVTLCLNTALMHREALKKQIKDLGKENIQLRFVLAHS